MSTNEQYSKYIDKDKILPFINERLDTHRKMLNYGKLNLGDKQFLEGQIVAYTAIKQGIELGMWTWQRGSE